jgi:hypothetical protein
MNLVNPPHRDHAHFISQSRSGRRFAAIPGNSVVTLVLSGLKSYAPERVPYEPRVR